MPERKGWGKLKAIEFKLQSSVSGLSWKFEANTWYLSFTSIPFSTEQSSSIMSLGTIFIFGQISQLLLPISLMLSTV